MGTTERVVKVSIAHDNAILVPEDEFPAFFKVLTRCTRVEDKYFPGVGFKEIVSKDQSFEFVYGELNDMVKAGDEQQQEEG